MTLSLANLQGLPPHVSVPRYDPGSVAISHAHIGIGAFHRAHQAEYADDLLAAGPGPWGIVGINIHPPDLDRILRPQDGLYTRVTRDGAAEQARVIGSIRRTIMAETDPTAAITALADPALTVVTLTVTEKGLCHIPATGALDTTHPDIMHDAAHPDRPRSAAGLLVAALSARHAAGHAAPALLSCDNVSGNGQVLRTVVTGLAAMRDDRLARWIAREVAFPDSMVDRIVPATREADLDHVGRTLGVRDAAAVVCEPFRQWVIADTFRGPRPPWEHAGAEIVPDVRPYEAMKMRLLNGCQSALAYLGWLGGCAHTSDVMAVPQFARYAAGLIEHETAPTVTIDADLVAYRHSVLHRLGNTALRHTTWQIATDGSQKIAQRLLAPARAQLEMGAPFPRLALAIAAWMQFVSGCDLHGKPIEVPDILAGTLFTASRDACTANELVAALLRVRVVFGDDLAHAPTMRDELTRALVLLRDVGPIEAASRIGEASS